MKKNNCLIWEWKILGLQNVLRKMKITIFLLLISVISIFANDAYSQTKVLNLDLENSTVKEVLRNIEEQSEFNFMYSEKVVDVNRKVSVTLKEKKIDEVLDELFDDTDVDYKISDRFILLSTPEATGNNNAVIQQQTITGKIVDETGEPMPGVTIVVKGTTNGTITDFEGNYTLGDIPENAILQFSFVGMKSQEVEVGNQSIIDIVLEVETVGVDEIIVTGYQTIRKSDLTGSVAVVNIEDTKDVPSGSVLQSLQGKVPGLYVTSNGSPSGNSDVNIRGINTLGNTNPLYIIDGAPTTDPNVFAYMDQNSIETVQVLKDASAASIYGSRASNGVIIVTTKTGKGELNVQFNSSYSLQKFARRLDVANTEQYGRILWQGGVNDGIDPNNALYTYDWNGDYNNPVLNAVYPVDYINGDTTVPSADTDWQDETFQTGVISSNSLIVSGGTDKSSSMVNLSYFHNKGMIVTTKFSKVNLRVNNTFNFFDNKLKIGENLELSQSLETPTPSDAARSVVALASDILPILPVYKTDGSFAGPLGAGFSDRGNPVHMAEVNKYDQDKRYGVFGNIFIEVSPIENLKIRSSFGIDYGLMSSKDVTQQWQEGFLSQSVNSLSLSQIENYNKTWSNTINYQMILDKSRVNIMVGNEVIENMMNSMGAYREDFALNDIDYFYLDAGTGSSTNSGSASQSRLVSYFGNLNYIFDDKYLLSATVRYDGSSKFGKENRFGLFPAASVGWVINKERFMQNLKSISNIKLRAGYGVVGNQAIGDYSRFQLWRPDYAGTALALWGLGGTAYDLSGVDTGTLPSGFRATQSANPDLKWESTTEINTGIDFGVFDQKISGSFDYFWRETKDILTDPPSLGVYGEGATQVVNGATMQNKGWEFSLGYSGEKGDWGYGLRVNLSHFVDEITYLPENVVRNYPGNTQQTIIGHSVTSVFGYVTDGIFQNQDEVDAHANQPGKGIGRIRYKDLTGPDGVVDGVVDAYDQKWLGSTNPDLLYGISGEISYKNFSLNLFVRGVQGILVDDVAKAEKNSFLGSVAGMNKGVALLDAWTPQNTSSTIPMLSFNNNNDELRTSDYTLVNGSYIKLQTVQFNYTLPSKLTEKAKLKNVRFYCSGENLLVFFDKKGADSFTGPDPETPGISATNYPKPVKVTFGCDITF